MNGTPIIKKGWTLQHAETGITVLTGDSFPNFRGESVKIEGGTPPHHEGSTGRIWTPRGEFFPSVCGLVWVSDKEI